MASRTPRPNILFTNVAMNTATTSSTTVNVIHADTVGIQATWTTIGSAGVTGSLKLQASVDFSPSTDTAVVAANVTNWSDIPGSMTSSLSSGSTSQVWSIDKPGYSWLKLVYVGTAGSGTLNARSLTKNL